MKKFFTLLAVAMMAMTSTWAQNIHNKHEYVDLGLPSGTLWATCNVGAETPDSYGNYYSWGETKTKETYNWSTYFDTNDGGNTFTKYTLDGGKTEIEDADDVAVQAWGGNWRIPTMEQFNELRNNCYWVWTNTYNGKNVNGFIAFKKKSEGEYDVANDAHIFLPAAGFLSVSYPDYKGRDGRFWARSLHKQGSNISYNLGFNSDATFWDDSPRYFGQSVRPVCKVKNNVQEYVDLGLTSGTMWATCNVGATSPESAGCYFAWGETTTKETYDWETYFDTSDDGITFDKYYIGGQTMLSLADDAANKIMGERWVTPSHAQQLELIQECYWVWGKLNDVEGFYIYKVKDASEKGKIVYKGGTDENGYTTEDTHIFIPANGYDEDDPDNQGCQYWSRNLSDTYSDNAWRMYLGGRTTGTGQGLGRYHGFQIRAVYVKDHDTPTAIGEVKADGVKARKVVKNGQLVIEKEGKSFDLSGREVK